MDYMAFSDEIESIFTTKNLEKMPTAQVHGGLIIMGTGSEVTAGNKQL